MPPASPRPGTQRPITLQGAGEAGEVRAGGREVVEFAAVEGVGGDAGGEGFSNEAADGGEALAVEFGAGEFGDEVAEGEAVDVEEGGGAGGEGDFVGGGSDGG